VLIDRLVGSEIVLVTPQEYKREGSLTLLAIVGKKLKERGLKPYLIPVGGSNTVGTWGYLNFVEELLKQMEEMNTHFDDIVLAIGSGGSAAGIALGIKLSGLPIRVHAISVCDSSTYFHSHINQIYEEMQSPYRSEEILDVIDGYQGPAYGVASEEQMKMLIGVARESGIILDPVYTGKAFHGFVSEITKEKLVVENDKDDAKGKTGQSDPSLRKFGKKILFVHTGGLFGLFGQDTKGIQSFFPTTEVSRLFSE